ncbi:hypothetical protein J421_6001 (plasmid) [Gemmatirosa kalamazoonensis]|uniref:Uncharacterized protein n=1 Tax=Gemmatirosa kalamazoonensis TaxID=861299 RepID=W0RS57_9BACT|nr:hypothetical protein [Gemmatirosa kalamazoonensis]AHG93536.1 hypothetical protein J421_6001 [Gemmatirosa kalamazoonensis]
MIERLTTALRTLADREAVVAADTRADAADAASLALDCMQNDLTTGQRAALRALWELLEDPTASPDAIRSAASTARAALGA